MFEKFTEKAIKVITDAQKEALYFKHSELMAEHVFLAILAQKSGVASKFLKATGMSYEFVKIELEKLDIPKNSLIGATLPFSDELKNILKVAWDKSVAMQNHSIMPEHLFLGILNSKNINVLKLLNSFDVDIARVKNSIERIIQKKTQHNVHPEIASNFKPMNEYSGAFELNSFLENEDTKEIFISANEFTKDSNYEAIGSAQLLSAILDEDCGNVFDELGVDKEKLIRELNSVKYRKDDYDTEFLYTPKAKEIVGIALNLAKESGSSCVYAEHLLAAILKSKTGSAHRVLKEKNINIKYLKQKVMAKIEQQKTTSMKILKLAKQEALRLGHDVVGSEQILLGIIAEESGIGAKVLKELGVTIKDARKCVEKEVGFGDNYEAKNFFMSPRAKNVIDHAWVEAKQMGKDRIDSEHILLGIIKEKDCVANKVLELLGVDAVEIEQGIKKKL